MTRYYNTLNISKTGALHRALMLVICLIASLTNTNLWAQTNDGNDAGNAGNAGNADQGTTAVLHIGGSVFGGGNAGDVGASSTVELYDGTIQGSVYGGGNEADVAQYTSVTISGGELNNNVYGAGNQGDVTQSSTVTLKGGTIKGDVYGGACMANVGERTFVDINATNPLIVKAVYGGNDVSGTIGTSTELSFTPKNNTITKDWNSFIRVTENSVPVIIGSLYGGGNGAYDNDIYTDEKTKPVLAKTYIELNGGIYGQVYAGGNNATVTGNTVLYMNNSASLSVPTGDFRSWFDNTDYSTEENGNITFKHHVSRMFGGNNLAEMAIRPTWNLIAGRINNLYSGGNKGTMTNANGILLPLTSDNLYVNNVYGGCRMADVNPGETLPPTDTYDSYSFPAGYATRVYITAGHINNVYGGNDISGKVHYGTNLAIFGNIEGDVYGGGNGSYAYTDKIENSDYYYETPQGSSSIDALFNFRPHIEKTLIHIAGNDDQNPLNLHNVYCGGNSAPIYSEVEGATAILKLGKNISKIDKVFLGSNGANMATERMLNLYKNDGFSSLDFTNSDVLARYMDGVSVNAIPNLEIENEETNITIGSFFCGGNVGSMTYAGVADITLPSTITITDKIVAGCNDAVVPAVNQLNALYEGGILGPQTTTVNSTESKDRVKLTVHSKLSPTLENGVYKGANVYGGCYTSGVIKGNVEINVNSNIISSVSDNITLIPFEEKYLPASTLSVYGGGYGSNTTIDGNTTINLTENARILKVFGGGEMGSVLGTATINLNNGYVGNVYGGGFAEGYTAYTQVIVPATSAIKANALFGGALGESEGRPCDVGVSNIAFASANATVEDGIYGGNHAYRATEETNITISTPVKNQYGNLLSIYGAGYGAGTVAGFTNVTLEAGAQVAKVYGGGREGKVYNHYKYCTINGYPSGRQASWTTTTDAYNTHIDIKGTDKGIARVTGNVYGAGYGENAHTSGKTKVQLLGGTVDGDIYGGGEKGSMPVMTRTTNGFIAYTAQTIASLCVIEGGQVRNVFGGGYQGDIDGNSGVNIGTKTGTIFYAGVPTILRSAYGGGQEAKVSGTATVNMYNGYVGYRYDATNGYQPELKLNNEDDDNLLKENGNLYGAGFGEGAVVMQTKVNLHGGVVRNGVYGGGEIASVGSKIKNNDDEYTYTYGQTNVYMYGGLVEGDVFGGGRGFSYDETGNQMIGEILYTDGYVFGKTNVEIYRGTIGTDASVAEGHGNVFGGGNIGYVYSAGVKSDGTDGKIKGHYYHKTDDGNTPNVNETTIRTEDCRVHIAAGALVTANTSFTINNHPYSKGDFVPNADLNTLIYNPGGNDHSDAWNYLDTEGVTIRNAVFAGGNVSAGSDKIYANAVTVFGNATASVVDVFSRDFITLGGEHVGGLYGDGNLTFVDGYRELNITNYGTDYYHLKASGKESLTTLDGLLDREKAYYTMQGSNWIINTTSGRTMNTIQRADFCGVFGSRFLLHGAQDRVPDQVDYTNYTINRVGEVSLNTKTVEGTTHGNYFGIYNVVNELGALTSNVEFNNAKDYPHQYLSFNNDNAGSTITSNGSYLDYKKGNINNSQKNIAISPNMVALASGVYLELLYTDPITNQKEYGPITGVIELDLLNVQPGEGGGYVYAKNEHGTPASDEVKTQLTLSDANKGAVTHRAFSYTTDNANPIGYQTSGNFVHASNTIIDNCFNDKVHYWYVSGTIYVYDQKISAYTGAVDTRQQSLNIPLSINEDNLKNIKIDTIMPNKYFIGAEGVTSFAYGNKVYQLNDPISYWDYSQLPPGQGYADYFVDMTYIAQSDYESDDESYNKGDVISQETYNTLSDEVKKYFCITNEMSHDNGYMLTFEMTNPEQWGAYFTNSDGNSVLEKDKVSNTEYEKAPTIKCNESGIYGQRSYQVENLINSIDYNKHQTIITYINNDDSIKGLQAIFEPAYYVKESILVGETHYNVGSYIAQTKISTELQNKFKQAYICTSTIEVSENEFILNGDWISYDQYDNLTGFQYAFSPAYVCTKAGLYGGVYYQSEENLTAEEFCDLSWEERNRKTTADNDGDKLIFEFNKDALDLLVEANHDRYKEVLTVNATPKQTATLYVPRESNIENLSKDRIITVILNYKVEDQTPEKHVVNIHVEFKTGQPTIGNIIAPPTVLPNTIVGLSTPTVTRGAYEIIGGGWEIYKNEADARAHKNGEPYINNTTPMYWYQDGYHVAYYAKTYLGKTYSNPVKFSVANYHRLGEVMNHKVLNGEGQEVHEYLYIDHEDAHRNRSPKIYIDAAGSENVNMNDLDYLAELYTKSLDADELDEQVKGCANLEFILRSDIAPKNKKDDWTSIGDDTQCFAGTLHGNGYTISGLNNVSLFGHLGGKVYNLGVNGGNIASNLTNDGRIENVWVSATDISPDISGDNVVNYYFLTNGNAASFEKGEVTHSLNSFYANRNTYNADGYVEKYFDDGDFIYAKGEIPTTKDIRYDETSKTYLPIADDYIFFGQRLTYKEGTHGSLPTRIDKVLDEQNNVERINRAENGNRVYSAPAYFMSNEVSQVYFNTAAKFVDSYDKKPIHHNLTAIDFTGHGNGASKLDIEELKGFEFVAGLTKNLLVYATENANANSPYTIVSGYLNATEPSLAISSEGYQTIAANNTPVRGHLVTKQTETEQTSVAYIAETDHFLVDKENFNVPIPYKFIEPEDDNPGTRMWYQRTPDRFAEVNNAGWDIICLPFKAQLVTTHQKGEITHFYGSSTTNHEYWLRELKEVTTTDGDASTITASFTRPAAVNGSNYKATSTYLYETYYKDKNDGNGDQYQQSYYADNSREYPGYAYLQANTPYIIAFPGATYKEFDMSGNLSDKDDLTAQVVTMVSAAGVTIPVTDSQEEVIKSTASANGYSYSLVGTFQATPITNGYLINSEGNAFEKAQSSTVPFRGYLVKTPPQSGDPKRIFIGGEMEEEVEEPKEDIIERGLTIYTQKEAIHIESTLEHEAAVVIYSTSGQVIAKVKVQPMSKEVVEVPQGIYIINKRKVMVM